MASLVAVVGLMAISRVEWPAFNSSNQLHALTTVGQFVCLAGLFARRAGCGGARRAGGSHWRWIARIGAVVFLSAFSVVTLAMPLGATKLYLFGISVDQQFRTEYLTRLTDSDRPARHDLHRAAAVLPARLVLDRRPPRRPDRHAGLGDVQAVVDHLDHRGGRGRVRVVGGDDSLRVRAGGERPPPRRPRWPTPPTEPYAAIITVLLPPVFVLAWSGLRAEPRRGRRLGRGRRRRRLPRASPRCSTRCCWPTPRSRWR